MKNSVEKDLVRGYWDEKSCGEVMIVGDEIADGLAMAAEERYRLEPYIHDFADFPSGRDKDILEIGVGMGADHVEWARHEPCSLTGLDLTQRAIEFAGRNLAANGLSSALQIGDAENLPFCDDVFDIVYSWGVLHHSPDTPKAIREVWRVLKPGGAAKVMIYHRRSMVGFMLWLRYALMTGKPGRSLRDIYYNHVESPGTKAYSREEAQAMFSDFAAIGISIQLNHGDLLMGAVGQRHHGTALSIAKAIWPRWIIRSFFSGCGLYLLISARK